MLILIALTFITHQTVVYEFDATLNPNNKDNWQGFEEYNFYTCGGITYFGTTTFHFQITRIFQNLEAHSHVQVDAEFIILDANQQLQIYLDNKLLQSGSVSFSQTQNCGSKFQCTISKVAQHNKKTAWIEIDSQTQGGLLKLKLSIIKCKYGCVACIENYPIICLQWKYLTLNLDGWTGVYSYILEFKCGQCFYLKFQEINYSTPLPPHKDLLIRFYKGNENPIIINYIYGKQIITSGIQLIEFLITNHPDSILHLQFRSESDSKLRDFEVFYSSEDKMLENSIEGCLEQINNQCLICKEGWIWDEILQNCSPICGDKIIQGQELCDDGNSIPYDGCFNCKSSCCEFCIICQFEICLECQDGYIINNNFKCDPLCGDGQIMPYSFEQCEIETQENQEDCQDCRFSTIKNCKTNYLSICFECEEGFYFQENQCKPYFSNCGDQIISKEED